jgi:hypothetical protein
MGAGRLMRAVGPSDGRAGPQQERAVGCLSSETAEATDARVPWTAPAWGAPVWGASAAGPGPSRAGSPVLMSLMLNSELALAILPGGAGQKAANALTQTAEPRRSAAAASGPYCPFNGCWCSNRGATRGATTARVACNGRGRPPYTIQVDAVPIACA